MAEARDGAEALEAIRADPPDVCVLDVMMPKVDGWEVLSEVRSDPRLSELPVVMLTAKGEPQARLKGWELGCDAFIPKPFDPPDCLTEVSSVLARDARERASIRDQQMAVVRAMTNGNGGRRAG